MIDIHDYLNEEERTIYQTGIGSGEIKQDTSKNRFSVVLKGVQSNLSVKQYITTKSKCFLKRSEQQVICDQFQQPLALWHGSFQLFDKFQPNDNGIYLAHFDDAIRYSRARLCQEVGGISYDRYGIYFYECFIKMNKIYYCNNEKYRDIDVSLIWDQGFDGIIAYNTRDSHGTYDQYIVKSPEQIYMIQQH